MQFTYHINSGENQLKIDGDLYRHLFKVRRQKRDKNIFFRNLKDDNIYEYEVIDIGKKEANLTLTNSKKLIIKQDRTLHLAWCVVDPKTIEKTLPSLNELGISKLSFIYCQYSQKQFKINFDKLNKILIKSSEQCGRSNMMKLELYDSLELFLNEYPNSYMFNFSPNSIESKKDNIDTIVVGCEGGFSKDEVANFNQDKIVGVNLNLILQSQTALMYVSSKIL
jgi:16S rRNA (uracil1498-N3)-methyltransferase